MKENLKFKYGAPEVTVFEVQAEGRVIMGSDNDYVNYPEVEV